MTPAAQKTFAVLISRAPATTQAPLDRGHRRVRPDLYAEPGERPLGLDREVLGKGGEDPRAGLDEEHPRLARIDAAEVPPHHLARDLADRARKLDAGRPAAHDHERHQLPPALLVGLALGPFEGGHDAPADLEGVVEALQPRRRPLPLVVPEVGVPDTGGEDQVVVGKLTVGEHDPAAGRSTATTSAIQTRVFLWRASTARIG